MFVILSDEKVSALWIPANIVRLAVLTTRRDSSFEDLQMCDLIVQIL
jgi:hypothetical protein